MQFVLHTLKKHPIAIGFYLLYLLLCLGQLRTESHYQEIISRGEKALTIGEAVMYGYSYIIFICIVFTMVIIGHAATTKEARRFYVALCFLIILPAVMVLWPLFTGN